MGWRDIQDGEVDSLSPITVSLMTALRDNVTAVAQRALGAPKVKPPTVEVLDTVGSSTWTVPDGVTRVRYQVIGQGGGGADEEGVSTGDGSDGADSTLNDGTTTYTGGGGAGGVGDVNSTSGGAGGTATNGDLNLSGVQGFGGINQGIGGITPVVGSAYGRGGDGRSGAGGGSGAVAIGTIEVTPGASLAYTVGGGANGGGDAGEDGAQGAIILEY